METYTGWRAVDPECVYDLLVDRIEVFGPEDEKSNELYERVYSQFLANREFETFGNALFHIPAHIRPTRVLVELIRFRIIHHEQPTMGPSPLLRRVLHEMNPGQSYPEFQPEHMNLYQTYFSSFDTIIWSMDIGPKWLSVPFENSLWGSWRTLIVFEQTKNVRIAPTILTSEKPSDSAWREWSTQHRAIDDAVESIMEHILDDVIETWYSAFECEEEQLLYVPFLLNDLKWFQPLSGIREDELINAWFDLTPHIEPKARQQGFAAILEYIAFIFHTWGSVW
jgi:hypothetical protein